VTKKKANIYDVAALAGVSHQTVSRVLNDHPSIKPATRERVEEAIKSLAYRPNPAARQLVTAKSRIIGLLVGDTGLYGPAGMLNAMETQARAAGYFAFSVAVQADSRESWLNGIEHLGALHIEGMVTIALPRAIFADVKQRLKGIALMSIDTEGASDKLTVQVDNFEGGRLATQHLIGLGHKNIVHITGLSSSNEANERERGYLTAIESAGLKPNVVVGDWSSDTGYSIASSLDFDSNEVTAVFCANDHLALGVLKALSKRGITVPDRVSVMGFDDVPESAYFQPGLTTVKQDFKALGAMAMEHLLAQLNNVPDRADQVLTPVLVVRESVAPPPKNLK